MQPVFGSGVALAIEIQPAFAAEMQPSLVPDMQPSVSAELAATHLFHTEF